MNSKIKARSWLLAAGLAAAAALPARASEWITIANPPPVIGADGKEHAATCSGYPGTDPSYRFWVRPGDPKKLAVIFDGGGACWNDTTCSFPIYSAKHDPLVEFYTPDIPADVDPSKYGGLLDLGNPANPVRDWTLVTVPYCTGDVHMGSIDRTYKTVGHPKLPKQITIHHRGYDNFMVVLNWISTNVAPGVTDLFVTGGSAGAYGAAANFPWLAQQYPQARLTVLADAGQGVVTPSFDNDTPGRHSWNLQLAPWVFGDDPYAAGSNEILRRGAQAYPNGRFSQYTTAQDSVQTAFYQAMKLFNGPAAPGSCKRTGPDWNNKMLATLADYTATLPNFRSYVLSGTSHTIIADSGFYADNPTGVRMSDWVQGMLNFDPGWTNAFCADCLTPVRCR